MDLTTIIGSIVAPILIFYLGTIEKRIADMKRKVDYSISRRDAQELITLNRKDSDAELKNTKEDILEVKVILEKILTRLA